MARTRKGTKASRRERWGALPELSGELEEDADLPKDAAGRRKIKRQYAELLGIRIEKLRGRVLNRERINKTIEGVYFICHDCAKVCHSLDDGLAEDPDNLRNLCAKCSKARAHPAAAARTAPLHAGRRTRAGGHRPDTAPLAQG